jgi:nucleoside-diphosphate-sugar epimerase
MNTYVIVGAGPVGGTVATMLAERGDRVRLVTRSGGGPDRPGVERIAADASDAARLTALTEGAATLFNCANPAYDRWLTDWPPLGASLLTAAERSGATLVTMSQLYMYGEVDGVIRPDTPEAATHPKLKLRGDMWRQALDLHRAGRIRTAEVRASDYIESNGVLSYSLGKPLLAGRRGYAPGPLDVPHSWSSITDVARTLVTAASDERALGRVWFAPTNPAMTIRQLAAAFTAANGAPRAKVTEVPYPVMWTMGLFNTMLRELRTTRYQFAKPFVIDSSETTATFGLAPTPLDEALRAAAANVRKAG